MATPPAPKTARRQAVAHRQAGRRGAQRAGPTGQQAERHEDQQVDGEGQQAVPRRVVLEPAGVLRIGAGRQADVDGGHEGQRERRVLDERGALRRLVAEGLRGRDDVRPMEVVEGGALLAGRAPQGGVVLVGRDVAEGGRHGQQPDAGQDDHRRDHGRRDESGIGASPEAGRRLMAAEPSMGRPGGRGPTWAP